MHTVLFIFTVKSSRRLLLLVEGGLDGRDRREAAEDSRRRDARGRRRLPDQPPLAAALLDHLADEERRDHRGDRREAVADAADEADVLGGDVQVVGTEALCLE